MPYAGEARFRFKGPADLCSRYIPIARVLVERTLAMYDVRTGGGSEAATQTQTLADGAVIRVTVFAQVPPIITIYPAPATDKKRKDHYLRCYNGLAVDYTPPDTQPLPAGRGYLKLADSQGLLPVDAITGSVDWDHPDIVEREWPMPVDSQLSRQYRPGLAEPHYLSGSGANLCDRSSEWYWEHEGVLWRVEARTTEPVILSDPEPELTDVNTRKMPLDYQAADIPNKLYDAPVVPENTLEPSYQLTDVLYCVRKMVEVVERDKWKVGLLLRETPVRVVGAGSLPEPRQRTVWLKFEGPTRCERYTSRGQTDSTPVWGHLRLHEVTESGALFTVVGTIAFVGESNRQHIVRGYGASDRGTLLLAPDLTYTITENPNLIYDTEQDNRTAIPNSGQTLPVVRWVFNRTTVQTGPDTYETTDTVTASLAYEDPAPLDPTEDPKLWVVPSNYEATLWRFTVIPAYHNFGTEMLYDETFSWGVVKIQESWTFDYERTVLDGQALPALDLAASCTAVHGDGVTDAVTARSVEGNAEAIIDMVADQRLAATYTVTVGAQTFTIPFSAVHKVTDRVGWAWGADPVDIGPISFLGSSLISYGIGVSQNGYGDYSGPRLWEQTISLDGEQYTFSFTAADSMSSSIEWDRYTDTQSDFLQHHVLVPNDRSSSFYLPLAMTEFMKYNSVSIVPSTYRDQPVTPQRVFKSMPVVSTVSRPGLLYVKWTFPQFEFNAPAFSVDYIFTEAGHKVMMHPNNKIASSNEDGIIFFDHLQVQEPLDLQTLAIVDTLPIDACYNPQTQQLYLRYKDDPPGCFVQMADVEKTVYKVKPGEERPDDIIIPRAD